MADRQSIFEECYNSLMEDVFQMEIGNYERAGQLAKLFLAKHPELVKEEE